MDDKKKRTICVVVLIGILVLSYILVAKIGRIENSEVLVPTGNVDIFEISCKQCCGNGKDDGETEVPNTGSVARKNGSSQNESVWDADGEEPEDEQEREEEEGGGEEEEKDLGDVVVYDDYKIWDNKDLRIFANPAYEYKNKIAPGSYNAYSFIIRNNNDFDVMVDIVFDEVNEKNVNMQYKLKNDGNYLLGSVDNYETIRNKVIKSVNLPAKDYKSYVLDWKWVDGNNDAEVGFDVSATYKLSIIIKAK